LGLGVRLSGPLSPIITAAGIAFIAGKSGVPIQDRLVLFLQRSGEGDHAGEWCLPGGKLEDGETAKEAARRECREETGVAPKGELFLLTRTKKVYEVAVPTAPDGTAAAAPPPLSPAVPLGPVIDFTTYAQKIEAPFEVKLDGEHTAYTWAPANRPPQPLHPGVAISLARLSMNELDIAEAMVRGDLLSPQYHHNMAMFDMRITGTGMAYRRGIKEYVFRKPEIYLNDTFLKRCNGLNVILEHPEKATLDSKEFGDRIVGNIFVPYIKGDEVWGIAKVYDDTTIRMLETGQLSTSPSVVFRDPKTTNSKITLDGGETVLIEGDPNLLDHLAICPKGVWDKGGEPRGIEFETRKDDDMTPEEQAAADKAKKDAEIAAADKARKDAEEKEAKEKADAERAKADAEAGQKLDKLLTCVDSLAGRMDAWDAKEKAKADAEAEEKRKAGDPDQVAADKAKKDAEAEKADKARKDAEEKEKADRARADAETRDSIQKLADAIPKPMSDDELNAMADAQSRADSIWSTFGKSAPRPLPGENLLQYRRRNASALKVHSPAYKDVDLSAIADDDNGLKMFEAVEKVIYADAERAGNSPADVPVDTLMETRRPDVTGRQVSTFRGQPRAWMDGFSGHRRRLTGIRNR
jgi:8-oxo-dGTP pyrophosphatase MutT (NUDIX family)